ncbi:MAG: tetratricopeptide repeat protein [Sulfurimonas sp.]|jgi:tetratricopeptide (TPR) repeat protein
MKDLEVSLKTGEHLDSAYNNIAVYYALSQPQQALTYYDKALEYQEESKRATTYNNMALCYGVTGNPSKKEEMYLKAIAIGEQTGQYANLMGWKNNLGTYYATNNRFGEARPLFNDTLKMARNMKIIDRESAALSGLAYLDYKENKPKQAKEEITEALRLAYKSGDTSALDSAEYVSRLINGN